MNSEHLSALLAVAGTEQEGQWACLKDDRTMTLHLAKDGVGLNVAKLRKVRIEEGLVFAENLLGDTFVIELQSLFAGSVDPPSKESRKAGFR